MCLIYRLKTAENITYNVNLAESKNSHFERSHQWQQCPDHLDLKKKKSIKHFKYWTHSISAAVQKTYLFKMSSSEQKPIFLKFHD